MLDFTSFDQLGPLEKKMLEEMWSRGNATVREIKTTSEYAYTTLMTTLDRLHSKGLLSRTAEGRGYRYFPVFTRSELQQAAAGRVIRDLLVRASSSYQPLLSHFVDVVADQGPTLLDALQQSIDEKRKGSQTVRPPN